MSRATIQDIADAVGVTKMTVSRALRGVGRISKPTQQRVREAARDLGYLTANDCVLGQPAHRGKSDLQLRLMVPILSDSGSEVKGSIGGEIVRGMQDRLAFNHGTVECVACRTIEDILEAMDEHRSNGLVLRWQVPVRWVDTMRSHVPVVYASSLDFYPKVDAAYSNEMRSAVMLNAWLYRLGHRHVAWFGLLDLHVDEQVAQEYFQEMGEVDRSRLSIHGPRYAAWSYLSQTAPRGEQSLLLLSRDWRQESLEDVVSRGLRQLLESPTRPTAIVVPSATIAVALARKVAEAGLHIGVDLSLVCYGDEPPILLNGLRCATVQLPFYDIGRAIPDLFERRLADPDALPLTLMFETTLDEGQSVVAR